jgi:DNA-directed RNA polymerase subunit RPC12/RpoP
MKTIRLQVFRNKCARCGAEFESLEQPRDYDDVLYVSDGGEMRFVDPETDPVWSEVSMLIDTAAPEVRNEMTRAALFHLLLARTIDAPVGDAFRSAWEKTPCPRCGSRDRSYFGPVDPPRFQDVSISEATHRRWDSLSREEKASEAKSVVTSAQQSAASTH